MKGILLRVRSTLAWREHSRRWERDMEECFLLRPGAFAQRRRRRCSRPVPHDLYGTANTPAATEFFERPHSSCAKFRCLRVTNSQSRIFQRLADFDKYSHSSLYPFGNTQVLPRFIMRFCLVDVYGCIPSLPVWFCAACVLNPRGKWVSIFKSIQNSYDNFFASSRMMICLL
jgi:hypothetical protein